jgi:hypothetical protein
MCKSLSFHTEKDRVSESLKRRKYAYKYTTHIIHNQMEVCFKFIILGLIYSGVAKSPISQDQYDCHLIILGPIFLWPQYRAFKISSSYNEQRRRLHHQKMNTG